MPDLLPAAREHRSGGDAGSGCAADRRRRAVLLLPVVWVLSAAAPPAARAQPASRGAAAGTADTGKRLRIGVVGSGRIGSAVGARWVKAGHEVMFASRHPEQLKPLTDRLGPRARAGTVAEAVAFGDVVLMAVPYGALPDIGREHGKAMAGKVVLDAMNAYRGRDGVVADEVAAKGIGATTARYLPGARIVRAFNSMSATNFSSPEHPAEGPIAIPLAGDDTQALRVASQLVRDAGFEPVVIGGLSTSDRFAPGGPLFQQVGSAADMRRKMQGSAR